MQLPVTAEFVINRKGQIVSQSFQYVKVELTNERFERLCAASRFDLKADELKQIQAANAEIEESTTA